MRVGGLNIDSVSSMMALKTYYIYQEEQIQLTISDKNLNELTHRVFEITLSIGEIGFKNRDIIGELSNVLSRILVSLHRNDNFDVEWNGDKRLIIEGLTAQYKYAISSFMNNYPMNDTSPETITFEERFELN